jgi:uncharacterized repeat protein (TIGR01451 family)
MGYCQLPKELLEGDYSICVKNSHTLANRIGPPLAVDSDDMVDFGTLLEGDVDDNNDVSMMDFTLLLQSNDKCQGEDAYNANADLNANNCVNIDDRSLLQANFSKPKGNEVPSICEWDNSATPPILRKGVRDGGSTVTLRTAPIPDGLIAGSTFDVIIQVQANKQLVEGAAAYLNFDPTQLQVNHLTVGNTFDFVLQNEFDNTQGHINFAAGVWDNDVPKGTFTLVTINMTLLQIDGEETLSFNTSAPRQTEAASGGKSLMSEQQGGEIVIGEPAGKYTASGTILDKEGNPIAGVTVQVGDKTVITNEIGYWEITDLQEGDDYIATASKDGYVFSSKDFAVGNDQNASVNIKAESVLDIKVIPDPRFAQQGENITYTITVTNKGSETATGIVLTDTLPKGTNLISIETLDSGNCSAETISCTLSDLTPGATATIKLVISNTQAETLTNTAKVIANDYPADVQITGTKVIPYLSVSLSDLPDPVTMGGTLHYTVEVDLSQFASKDATGVELVMRLPNGVELENATTDYGTCDTSKLPTVTCTINDLSIASAEATSHITVHLNVKLTDMGLLLLTHEAKVTAKEYPAHSVKERTKVFIGDVKVDMVFVIDTTNSMAAEIDGVIAAMKKYIDEIEPSQAPLIVLVEFKDNVRFKAATRDLDELLGAVEDLKAEGGGTCPEASVEARTLAIEHLKEGGVILCTTDASPYPDAELEKLSKLINGKEMNLTPILTGDCSNRKRCNLLP